LDWRAAALPTPRAIPGARSAGRVSVSGAWYDSQFSLIETLTSPSAALVGRTISSFQNCQPRFHTASVDSGHSSPPAEPVGRHGCPHGQDRSEVNVDQGTCGGHRRGSGIRARTWWRCAPNDSPRSLGRLTSRPTSVREHVPLQLRGRYIDERDVRAVG